MGLGWFNPGASPRHPHREKLLWISQPVLLPGGWGWRGLVPIGGCEGSWELGEGTRLGNLPRREPFGGTRGSRLVQKAGQSDGGGGRAEGSPGPSPLSPAESPGKPGDSVVKNLPAKQETKL